MPQKGPAKSSPAGEIRGDSPEVVSWVPGSANSRCLNEEPSEVGTEPPNSRGDDPAPGRSQTERTIKQLLDELA